MTLSISIEQKNNYISSLIFQFRYRIEYVVPWIDIIGNRYLQISQMKMLYITSMGTFQLLKGWSFLFLPLGHVNMYHLPVKGFRVMESDWHSNKITTLLLQTHRSIAIAVELWKHKNLFLILKLCGGELKRSVERL